MNHDERDVSNSDGSRTDRNESRTTASVDRRHEFRRGLKETSKYLLSHHEEDGLHKCYSVSLSNRTLHLCSRCFGVYAGLLSVALVGTLSSHLSLLRPEVAVVVLPLPALVDWSVAEFTRWRGNNLLRTSTGYLLGFGYGTGLLLLLDGEVWVLGIGALYAAVAGVLLYRSKR
ncbi:MAG: DUF2085 domain-containing protein [Halobacteria archaeon]|nr:DUF2085 domain-containing protein [Halobacteria archaeon]